MRITPQQAFDSALSSFEREDKEAAIMHLWDCVGELDSTDQNLHIPEGKDREVLQLLKMAATGPQGTYKNINVAVLLRRLEM